VFNIKTSKLKIRVMLIGPPGALVKELKEKKNSSKRALYSLLRN
jgi:hypothetical protein